MANRWQAATTCAHCHSVTSLSDGTKFAQHKKENNYLNPFIPLHLLLNQEL
jgi:hypothetical protein